MRRVNEHEAVIIEENWRFFFTQVLKVNDLGYSINCPFNPFSQLLIIIFCLGKKKYSTPKEYQNQSRLRDGVPLFKKLKKKSKDQMRDPLTVLPFLQNQELGRRDLKPLRY